MVLPLTMKTEKNFKEEILAILKIEIQIFEAGDFS